MVHKALVLFVDGILTGGVFKALNTMHFYWQEIRIPFHSRCRERFYYNSTTEKAGFNEFREREKKTKQ